MQWPKLAGFGLALALNAFARRGKGMVCVLSPDAYSARVLRDDLSALGELSVDYFPDWEVLPYDLYSPHPDLVSRRLDLMAKLPQMDSGILIVPLTSLMQRLPPTDWLLGHTLAMSRGQHIGLEPLKTRLVEAGYQSTEQVWQPGQFAARGSVLDLWPMGDTNQPYRIEFFDEEIESIRRFDPDTQRSISKLDGFNLMPAREYPFDQAGREDFRRRFRLRFDIDLRRCTVYQDIGDGLHPQGLEQYLPLFFDQTQTLFDYLPANRRIVTLPGLEEACISYHNQIHQRYDQRNADIERPILKPDELFISGPAILETLGQVRSVAVSETPPPPESVDLPMAVDLAHVEQAKELLRQRMGRTLVCADTPSRREMIIRTLRSAQIPFAQVPSWHGFLSSEEALCVTTMPISAGLDLPTAGIMVLSESDCFPGHTRTRQQRDKLTSQDPEALIKTLADLQSGAPVVHLDHGIGRYRGLTVLKTADQVGEYLMMEYAGGDLLYVPVTDLALISRYTGQDPEAVTLHKLGSDQWKKIRRRAAEKVRDVAAELLHLQARRSARSNVPIPIDESLYGRFSSAFEYEETPDQQNAIEAVISDLASEQPMDRVICGDVGFGKTEVALRAAFLVAQAGGQVVLLAPTTLLAEQHYRQFADRFADWPVHVAQLSRSTKAQADVLSGLADGTIDILIGTHRVLQKDIQFKNLNLVIVDEEQRFGVRQKEQLKSLRAEVNLLTLTATPIPRTLNMAMSGLRELSIIATPPNNRLAVKTFVSEWDSNVVRDAIEREFQRGGQVYYLHNEVKTMERVVEELAALFPQANIGMAHGQMPASELEQTMRAFYNRRINLLVCSTIIENGIDVPSANTIIIQRADKFGLGQLHQLRGRVGRSHHLAFAHLITPPFKSLTKDAQKRLEAISSIEALGAGFMLASHDLEIRGAGELLGEDQSGQIEAIGFSLYSDLLKRAVAALKSGKEPDLDRPMAIATDIDLHTTALIPEDYLPDIHQRLIFYKRISQASEEKELHELEVEMIDRFGLLPEPIRHLFNAARLRLQTHQMGITRLELGPEGGRLEFMEKPEIKVDEFIHMIQQESHTFTLPKNDQLRIKGTFKEYEERLAFAQSLLARLAIDRQEAA